MNRQWKERKKKKRIDHFLANPTAHTENCVARGEEEEEEEAGEKN